MAVISRVLDKVFKNFNINFESIDTSDLALIESKITPDVKALYIETPSNPLLDITDLESVAKLGKKYNLLTIADNTFMSLSDYSNQLGLVLRYIHSATKYLGDN